MPDTLTILRRLCLALPEAEERETWEHPTFRVRDKIFAMVSDVKARPSVWFKAPKGVQALLIEAAPDRFFAPPYVGPKGWVGLWLDIAWDQAEAEALITRSWRMTAPKRLAAMLNTPDDTHASPCPRKSPLSRPANSRRKSVSAR
jgi:hypothetical protein